MGTEGITVSHQIDSNLKLNIRYYRPEIPSYWLEVMWRAGLPSCIFCLSLHIVLLGLPAGIKSPSHLIVQSDSLTVFYILPDYCLRWGGVGARNEVQRN